MLAIKIENKEFEAKFLDYVKTQKKTIEDVAFDAINRLINTNQKSKLKYEVKDPMKHLHKVQYEHDDLSDDLDDVKPYSHIEDSALYIHNLRREKRT